MGGKSSKGSSGRQFTSRGAASSSGWNNYDHPPPSPSSSPYPPEAAPYYTPQHQYAPQSSFNYGSQTPLPQTSFNYGSQTPQRQQSFNYRPQAPQPQRRLDRKYSRIDDNYKTLDQVTAALAQAGLESSNLIVGIDFTKSNEWTGARSFNRRSLHHIGHEQNPYEQAISIIGQTLSAFDEDNLIPCFGFGDASTHDQDVFSFFQDERVCNGFEEVLSRYREIVPNLKLAGPTSFAPVIEMAMTIVNQSVGQYHVLVIIADGQVTRSVDTQPGCLSPQEQKTIDAIVRASELPLSIILVGVGDGPWDMMKEFDDNIPARVFDNFQFVNFTEIMSKNINFSRKQTEFALAALMEIPSQYKATLELGLLGSQKLENAPDRVALPPPIYSASCFSRGTKPSRSSSFQQRVPSYSPYEPTVPASGYDTPPATTVSPSSSTYDNQACPICLTNRKDMAFGCGHQTCCDCGEDLDSCPICRRLIETRIRLY